MKSHQLPDEFQNIANDFSRLLLKKYSARHAGKQRLSLRPAT